MDAKGGLKARLVFEAGSVEARALEVLHVNVGAALCVSCLLGWVARSAGEPDARAQGLVDALSDLLYRDQGVVVAAAFDVLAGFGDRACVARFEAVERELQRREVDLLDAGPGSRSH